MLVFGHVIVDDFLWGPSYNLAAFSGCFAEGKEGRKNKRDEGTCKRWMVWRKKCWNYSKYSELLWVESVMAMMGMMMGILMMIMMTIMSYYVFVYACDEVSQFCWCVVWLFIVYRCCLLLSVLKCAIPSVFWIQNSPLAEIWFLVAYHNFIQWTVETVSSCFNWSSSR